MRSAFRSLALSADRMLSVAAFTVASHVSAVRNGVDVASVKAPVTPKEAMVLAGRKRDASSGQMRGDARRRTPRAAAREEAFYVTVAVLGRPVRSVAAVTGMSPAGVLKSVRAVEERRDDPVYDRDLDEMELQLMGGAA